MCGMSVLYVLFHTVGMGALIFQPQILSNILNNLKPGAAPGLLMAETNLTRAAVRNTHMRFGRITWSHCSFGAAVVVITSSLRSLELLLHRSCAKEARCIHQQCDYVLHTMEESLKIQSSHPDPIMCWVLGSEGEGAPPLGCLPNLLSAWFNSTNICFSVYGYMGYIFLFTFI